MEAYLHLFLTVALDGHEWSVLRLSHWTETPVSTEQEVRWAQQPAWTFWIREEYLALTGNVTNLVQTAA